MTNLAIEIAGKKFQNPVMPASGTFGYGEVYTDFFSPNELGAVVCKTIKYESWEGNPTPRTCETSCGMLNAIGLQNVGREKFVKEKMPFLRQLKTNIIVSIAGSKIEEYGQLAARLDPVEGIDFLEVNISCPNVEAGSQVFGTNPDMAAAVTNAVKNNTHLPIIVKLTPNVTDITVIAKAVEAAGADAICAINTLLGMSIDINTGKPRIAKTKGGYSGPGIKPIAIRMVYEIAEAVKIPVIGVGGIMNWEDAVEFMMAGATAIQVGTATFVDPMTMPKIIKGLAEFLEKQEIDDIKKLIGTVKT